MAATARDHEHGPPPPGCARASAALPLERSPVRERQAK